MLATKAQDATDKPPDARYCLKILTARSRPRVLGRMMKVAHWVNWKWKLSKRKSGKPPRWTKLPFQAVRPSQHARSNDASTWGTFEAAVAALRSDPSIDGIGFVLLGSGFAAIDLDACYDPAKGLFLPWAQGIIDAANTYLELTPSGTGARLIGPAVGDHAHRRFLMGGGSAVEVFRKCERFITVTGSAFPDTKDLFDPDINGEIDRIIAEDDAKQRRQTHGATRAEPGHTSDALPFALRYNIETPLAEGLRSQMFQSVVVSLHRRGWTQQQIVEVLAQYPEGPAEKFIAEGRLEGEVARSLKDVERQPRGGAAPRTDLSKIRRISFAQIKPSDDKWLIELLVPEDELTGIIGVKRRGKTAVLVDIIARVTTGRPPPNFDGEPLDTTKRKPRRVLVLCHEERAGMLRRRLERADADLNMVETITHEEDDEEVIAAQVVDLLPKLEAILSEEDDWGLLVIEPITSFVGGIKTGDDDMVREHLLRPLRDMVRRHHMACVFSIHMNKNEELSTLNRALNSVAFTNFPRSLIFLNYDPDDKQVVRLVGAGNMNNPTWAPGFTIRVVADERDGVRVASVPVLNWELNTIKIDADDLMAGKSPTPKRRNAFEWLSAVLADGGVDSSEVKARAKAEGISDASLHWASKKLKVVFERDGNASRWKLPT